MPFTPLHFGPGLLVKAASPKRVSFTAFAMTQVVIDFESLYHLVQRDWPVHRQLHSLVGASVVGLLVAAAVVAGRPALRRFAPDRATAGLASTTTQSALLGGLLGGITHSVLDAIMHSDVTPLWPFAASNRLLGVVSVGILETACVLTGAIGLWWLWLGHRSLGTGR